MASDDDEIARLLREVDAMTGTGSDESPQPAEPPPGTEVEQVADKSSSGRGRWVPIAAVSGGVAGALVGGVLWVFPFFDPVSTGIGAAGGAALAAAFGRAPKWLS